MLITTRSGNVVHLHRMTDPQGTRTPLTSGPEPVRSGWYPPNGGDLLVYQADQGGNENFQFYACDTANLKSAPVLLTDGQSRNTSPAWSYDGKWLAYASTRRNGKDSDIYLVNPADPKTTRCLLTNSSTGWAPADWTRDGTHLLVRRSLSDTETELWLVDAKTGERRLVTSKNDRHYLSQPRLAESDTAIYRAYGRRFRFPHVDAPRDLHRHSNAAADAARLGRGGVCTLRGWPHARLYDERGRIQPPAPARHDDPPGTASPKDSRRPAGQLELASAAPRIGLRRQRRAIAERRLVAGLSTAASSRAGPIARANPPPRCILRSRKSCA